MILIIVVTVSISGEAEKSLFLRSVEKMDVFLLFFQRSWWLIGGVLAAASVTVLFLFLSVQVHHILDQI